ncbi:MAG: MBL fold metallo-hydrolase [Ferrimicrobium sp.]
MTLNGEDTVSWEDPGVEEVSPGVHRIPLALPGDALRAVNCYLITDGNEVTLIDPGQSIPLAYRQLETALASKDIALADVTHLLVTHVHRDHYTQAIRLRQSFGARVWLGQDEAASLLLARDPETRSLGAQLELLRICGANALVDRLLRELGSLGLDRYLYEDPDEWLHDGMRLSVAGRSLGVIATPGHTRGHMVFSDVESGIVFTGDHILPHITPSIGFEPATSPLPLHSYLQSLRRIRDTPDARLLPAHGPVAPSVHARIDELLNHHRDRLDRTLKQVLSGRSSVWEVASGLHWTRRERTLDELDPFNQLLAVLETKAHLDVLVLQDLLIMLQNDGVAQFTPPLL